MNKTKSRDMIDLYINDWKLCFYRYRAEYTTDRKGLAWFGGGHSPSGHTWRKAAQAHYATPAKDEQQIQYEGNGDGMKRVLLIP